ncbi:MAG: phenylalanine--tRNA ligase subunit alpha [Nanoarchaeota archaeon]|nr:phenylalanine--tRNA ligase subunit alpha [Nanoarchaeota archaeon]
MNESQITSIIYKLHPLARNALEYCINAKEDIIINPPQEILDGAYLLEQDSLIQITILKEECVMLDSLGLKFLEEELPEYQVLKELNGTSKVQSELGISQEVLTSALGELKKHKLIEIFKNDEHQLVLTPTQEAQEYTRNYLNPLKLFKEKKQLESLSEEEKTTFELLQKRKGFLSTKKESIIELTLTTLGREVGEKLISTFKDLELIDSLTPQMIKSKEWKGKEFRHYDTQVPTSIKNIGRLHPMHEANDILTQVFIELGFKEMEGPIVESEFWCFDTLWIPQDHPAREDQDTFYIGEQADVDKELMDKVKEMHERGIDETHTQVGDFKESVTRNTILRTHSTATTFRTLYELGKKAQTGENIDGKYFYVAHNFRNEAVDATHLAEFFQVEGILIQDDLSLAGLIGFMKEFYGKFGLHNLKFKPTFNPYTEPSMEIHYFDDNMNKWYSIGNSGIFRPEALKAFGLENKRIYGFGLGASRIATLLTGKNNMREITGATCDLDWIENHKKLSRNILR